MMSISDDAQQLLDDFGLMSIPVNPIKVCEKLGIQYDEKPYDGFDGTLIVAGNEQIIGVNSQIKEPGRKAYTCAHEIGHYNYDLKDNGEIKCTRDDTGHGKIKLDKKELRANEFASELLMPKQLFLQEISSKEPSWEFIKKLASKFETSLQATTNRFVKLTGHTCWLIVVKNGKLQRYSMSDFNEFKPNLDGTFRVSSNLNQGWQSTYANLWLYPSKKTYEKRLSFWALPENQYGESLVLLWDKNNTLLEDSYELTDDDYGDKGEFSSIYWGKKR